MRRTARMQSVIKMKNAFTKFVKSFLACVHTRCDVYNSKFEAKTERGCVEADAMIMIITVRLQIKGGHFNAHT